jgi:hypothetical protein
MIARVLLFEVRYHAKRLSTYVYFLIWFLLGVLFMSIREGQENAVLNSPAIVASWSAGLMAFGSIVLSAVCGMAVCRDFEEDTYQILFTTRLTPRDYLVGRLAGSLLISLLVFTGVPLGLLAGTVMPWADAAHMEPIRLWTYAQPYLLFIATTTCAAGALFFALGALTRSVVFVYLQGVLFVAMYLAVDRLTRGSLNDFWPALLDPFGLNASAQVSKYWTLAERNTRLIPLAGAMLWNRALWLGVGAVAAAAALRFFPFSAEALGRRSARRRRGIAIEDAGVAAAAAPSHTVMLKFDRGATLRKWLVLTRLRAIAIVTDLPFIAIAVLTLALTVVNGWGAPRMQDTPVYPVTYLMMQNIGILMAVIVTAMYAGELVWKERALKYDQIHDTLPVPTWLNFTSQLGALTAVQVLILAVTMGASILLQTTQGYYRFELTLYLRDVFMVQLSGLVLYSVLALFLQTIVPHKFLGHAIVIGVFLGPGIFSEFADKVHVTIPAPMYDYATTPEYTYSDMNGYGPYVTAVVWYTLYWSAWAGVLAVGALVFARRGTDGGWRVRLRQARARLGAPAAVAAGACFAAFLGLGAYLYYDARIVNTEFTPRRANEAKWARYEKEFKQYESLPIPTITAVETTVDIVPERATIAATGTYTIVNKTASPIGTVHIVDGTRTLREASFDRPFKETRFDKELRYHIYQFDQPLAPGDTVHLRFRVGHENLGFQDTGTSIVANGTFSGAGGFPVLGYQRDLELDSEDTRRKQGLAKREDLPPPDRPGVRSRSLFSQDATWITFKATVSTAPDQIAIAPGYLTRTWEDRGRRYFEYDMGGTKIQNFYTFVSARYAVRRDRWRDVNIEVYYDPQHPYNVDRMIESTKTGLEYFTSAFGPYQFRQFRVLEFPRYASFAQSFANTVPFSEGIGFIFHPTKDDDLDYPLYVTAHELAHQWWGHQVIGAWAQGSNILSETLAEYSALMVLEHTLGAAGVRTYLKHDLDGYLRGRRGEQRGEQTLARVTRQGYVWYQKGSLVMYALKDYIGEARLNGMLRAFLEKTKFQEAPYTTVDDFLADLRAAMPADLKPLVADFFETITLFDNRAVSATWRETADHKFAVTMTVQSAKLRADDKGNEQAVPIDDLIDIGVFAGEGKSEKPLYLEKKRLTQPQTTFEIVVNERPSRAGIDPYNKLIDRVSDDNVVAVKKG